MYLFTVGTSVFHESTWICPTAPLRYAHPRAKEFFATSAQLEAWGSFDEEVYSNLFQVIQSDLFWDG